MCQSCEIHPDLVREYMLVFDYNPIEERFLFFEGVNSYVHNNDLKSSEYKTLKVDNQFLIPINSIISILKTNNFKFIFKNYVTPLINGAYLDFKNGTLISKDKEKHSLIKIGRGYYVNEEMIDLLGIETSYILVKGEEVLSVRLMKWNG